MWKIIENLQEIMYRFYYFFGTKDDNKKPMDKGIYQKVQRLIDQQLFIFVSIICNQHQDFGKKLKKRKENNLLLPISYWLRRSCKEDQRYSLRA